MQWVLCAADLSSADILRVTRWNETLRRREYSSGSPQNLAKIAAELQANGTYNNWQELAPLGLSAPVILVGGGISIEAAGIFAHYCALIFCSLFGLQAEEGVICGTYSKKAGIAKYVLRHPGRPYAFRSFADCIRFTRFCSIQPDAPAHRVDWDLFHRNMRMPVLWSSYSGCDDIVVSGTGSVEAMGLSSTQLEDLWAMGLASTIMPGVEVLNLPDQVMDTAMPFGVSINVRQRVSSPPPDYVCDIVQRLVLDSANFNFIGMYQLPNGAIRYMFNVLGSWICPPCGVKHVGSLIVQAFNGLLRLRCFACKNKECESAVVGIDRSEGIRSVTTELDPLYFEPPEEDLAKLQMRFLTRENICVPAGYDTVVIQSPMGTNKTGALVDLLKNCYDRNARLLYLSPRVALGLNFLHRMGVPDPADETFEQAAKRRAVATEADSQESQMMFYQKISHDELPHERQLALQADSLPKLTCFHREFDHVCIDEAVTFFDHFSSDTMKDRRRSAWKQLQYTLSTARHVSFIDADASDERLRYVLEDVLQRKVFWIKNEGRPLHGTEVTVMYQQEWMLLLVQRARSQDRFVVACSSRDGALALERLLKDAAPAKKIQVYCSVTPIEERRKLFNCEAEWSKYDIVIYTQTVGVGVDFNPDIPHFDFIAAQLSPGGGTDRMANQQLARCRNCKQRKMYLCFKIPEYDPSCWQPDKLYSHIMDVSAAAARACPSGNWEDDRDDLKKLLAMNAAERNFSNVDFEGFLIRRLIQRGAHVRFHIASDDRAKPFQRHRRHVAAMIAAEKVKNICEQAYMASELASDPTPKLRPLGYEPTTEDQALATVNVLRKELSLCGHRQQIAQNPEFQLRYGNPSATLAAINTFQAYLCFDDKVVATQGNRDISYGSRLPDFLLLQTLKKLLAILGTESLHAAALDVDWRGVTESWKDKSMGLQALDDYNEARRGLALLPLPKLTKPGAGVLKAIDMVLAPAMLHLRRVRHPSNRRVVSVSLCKACLHRMHELTYYWTHDNENITTRGYLYGIAGVKRAQNDLTAFKYSPAPHPFDRNLCVFEQDTECPVFARPGMYTFLKEVAKGNLLDKLPEAALSLIH